MLRYTTDLGRAGTAGESECIIQCCSQKYLLDSVGGDSTLYALDERKKASGGWELWRV